MLYRAQIWVLVDADGDAEAADGISESLRELCFSNERFWKSWQYVNGPAWNLEQVEETVGQLAAEQDGSLYDTEIPSLIRKGHG